MARADGVGGQTYKYAWMGFSEAAGRGTLGGVPVWRFEDPRVAPGGLKVGLCPETADHFRPNSRSMSVSLSST
jgi:hypothetical protein